MTAPPPGTTWRRTDASGPVPYSVRGLQLPSAMHLLPGAAGAFQRVVTKHKLPREAAQDLLDVAKDAADEEKERRHAYYSEQQQRWLKTHGAPQKTVLAKEMIQKYKRARGEQAHADLMRVLDRDAAFHGELLDLLAFAHGISAGQGGAGRRDSKGGRRYGAPRFSMERIASAIRDWFGHPEPSFAMQQQERADG